MVVTYVVPDRHDEDHGNPKGVVEEGPSTDVVESVEVVKDLKDLVAELGGDGRGVGKTLEGRGGDLNLLAVLDEELRHLVLLKASDDTIVRLLVNILPTFFSKTGGNDLRELLAGVDNLADTIEVGVTHAVGVIIATVGVAETVEAFLGVGTTAGVVLADVVVIVLARVGGKSEGVGVGLPIVLQSMLEIISCASIMNPKKNSKSNSKSHTKRQSRHSRHHKGRHQR